jgi:beta-lactamase regulating signal transducer with metallopeptidase domain
MINSLMFLFDWFVIASLKTIPLIVLVLAFQRFFGKYFSATSRHLLWFPVLISLTVPVGWQMDLTLLGRSESGTSSAPIESDRSNDVLPDLTNAPQITRHNEQPSLAPVKQNVSQQNIPHPYYFLLPIAWLMGIAIFMGLIASRLWYYHRIMGRAKTISSESSVTFKRCKEQMKVNRAVAVLASDEIQTPLVVSWITPIIIIPDGLEKKIGDQAINYIFLHELAHIKRHDLLFNWMVSLVLIIHWFNPLVWFACRHMRRSMESACDAKVLSKISNVEHKKYGETLIELSGLLINSPGTIATVGILENHMELIERLKMINQVNTINHKAHLLFGILFFGVTMAALAQPSANSKMETVKNEERSAPTQTIALEDFARQVESIFKKKLLVGHPNAKVPVTVNFEKDNFDYAKLLAQLKVNGFTALKSSDHIEIIPLHETRFAAVPVVEKNKTYSNDEYVTEYVQLNKTCNAYLIPTLRPMIPPSSHIGLNRDRKSFVITDSYGNIQRIKAVIKSIEDNMESPDDCKDAQLPSQAGS